MAMMMIMKMLLLMMMMVMITYFDDCVGREFTGKFFSRIVKEYKLVIKHQLFHTTRKLPAFKEMYLHEVHFVHCPASSVERNLSAICHTSASFRVFII